MAFASFLGHNIEQHGRELMAGGFSLFLSDRGTRGTFSLSLKIDNILFLRADAGTVGGYPGAFSRYCT
jgi:hypothetical protein